MLLKKITLSRQLLSLEFRNLCKTRGLSDFRLRDTKFWPGDDLQNRTYRRPWFSQHEAAAPAEEVPEVPNQRLDETMYSPRRWTDREYQSTWREVITEEDELGSEEHAETAAEPRYQNHAPKIPDSVPHRICEPPRRLQRVAIPAGEFFSKFISEQKQRKMRHYEKEVVADRLSNEGFHMA